VECLQQKQSISFRKCVNLKLAFAGWFESVQVIGPEGHRDHVGLVTKWWQCLKMKLGVTLEPVLESP